MNGDKSLHRVAERIAEAVVDGEMILMDLHSGKFFGLRGTALAIWQLIDGTRSEVEIKAALHDDYAVDAATCDREVDAFLASLGNAGLLQIGCK